MIQKLINKITVLFNKKCTEKVSVIVPVYNVLPCYIEEALESVLVSTYQNIEIIVVNDGSSSKETLSFFKSYNNPKVKIINQINMGLAEARNTGIKNATGKYILPLDADDKIEPTYIEKAVKIIDSKKRIGIVYCEADMFGAINKKWELPEFKMKNMLRFNCIFCTALFRKTDWERVGGYKKIMKYGWEDYEFWLSLLELGVKVYRIPEILFHYRQHEKTSMLTEVYKEKFKLEYLWKMIQSHHKELFDKYKKQIDGL